MSKGITPATQHRVDNIRLELSGRWQGQVIRVHLDSGGTGRTKWSLTVSRMGKRAGAGGRLPALGEFKERGSTAAEAVDAMYTSLGLEEDVDFGGEA